MAGHFNSYKKISFDLNKYVTQCCQRVRPMLTDTKALMLPGALVPRRPPIKMAPATTSHYQSNLYQAVQILTLHSFLWQSSSSQHYLPAGNLSLRTKGPEHLPGTQSSSTLHPSPLGAPLRNIDFAVAGLTKRDIMGIKHE